MKKLTRLIAAILLVISMFSALVSCEGQIQDIINGILGETNDQTPPEVEITQLNIEGEDRLTLEIGTIVHLQTDVPDEAAANVKWSASNECVTVSGGTVRAISEGACIVVARYGKYYDKVLIEVTDGEDVGGEDNTGNTDNGGSDNTGNSDNNTGNSGNNNTGNSGNNNTGNTGNSGSGNGGNNTDVDPSVDPYKSVTKAEFYANYTISAGYWDSYYRSLHGFMSGNIGDQDQEPTISAYQPMYNGLFVRNNVGIYGDDGNSYTIVDAYGAPVMTIYRGGAYVMLEEVAAYLFAFGEIPANHTPKKKVSQARDMFEKWGEYLRLNHSEFSGSTSKYPYEPELPNISGCGGDLQYYEVDVGTTGTDCDPSYDAVVYNNGYRIERGAARIVYSVYDKNGDKIIDINEKYLFYTYNHYNDFQEYLNYWGGWGEIFGNVTGGGTISSKYDYNPTPYVESVKMDITMVSAFVIFDGYFIVIGNKVYA